MSRGQLVLNDPQAATTKLPHLTVGLAHPDYTGSGGAFMQRSGNGSLITWAHDGNYYQFWTDGTDDGKFNIDNVRPGHYTLHAFADGVLGEFAQTDINVEAGKNLNLGQLQWQPVRYGKQVWDIGYPDRTADKFYKGDGANYWLWGWCVRYGDMFPNDITYTIGTSDYHKDWFFEQVPHATTDAWKNPAAKDPVESAVRVGADGDRDAGHVARLGPRAGDDLDDQVHYGQGRARAGGVARGARRRGWRGRFDGWGEWRRASGRSGRLPPMRCVTTLTKACGGNTYNRSMRRS